jgi:hypothetical protein
MVPRVLLLVALSAATLAGGARADVGAPVTLRDGQTRWFLDGQLRPGDAVRCVSGKTVVAAKVPQVPAGGVDYSQISTYGRRGLALDVERRSNGAVQARCGAATESAPRRPAPPYVIGQNGVGLIRGPNTLAALRRVYGPEGSLRRGAGCVAAWPAIGLRATFRVGACVGGAVSALATGPRWSSLDGTHIGDPVPELRWRQPGTKLVSTQAGESSWLLSKAHAPRRSTLVALVRGGGSVAAFRFSAGR